MGGIIGTLVGYKGLPKHMSHAVVDFDLLPKHNRYDSLSVKKYALPNIQKLIRFRPKKKLIIDVQFTPPKPSKPSSNTGLCSKSTNKAKEPK